MTAHTKPVAEIVAEQFHDIYEELAPLFGYQTREDTKIFDKTSTNGRLMIAVVERVLANQIAELTHLSEENEQLKADLTDCSRLWMDSP